MEMSAATVWPLPPAPAQPTALAGTSATKSPCATPPPALTAMVVSRCAGAKTGSAAVMVGAFTWKVMPCSKKAVSVVLVLALYVAKQTWWVEGKAVE